MAKQQKIRERLLYVGCYMPTERVAELRKLASEQGRTLSGAMRVLITIGMEIVEKAKERR